MLDLGKGDEERSDLCTGTPGGTKAELIVSNP